MSHSRSIDAVGACVSYCAALHVFTAAQAAALVSAENVCPLMQSAHWRSCDGEPSTDRPRPLPHVRHAVHDSLTAGANVPDAHGVHVALPDAAYWPATHGVHDAAPDDDAWPALHGVHVAAPSAAYEPASQGVLVAPLQLWPAGHVPHSRFDDAPGACVSYCTEVQSSMPLHARSLVPVGAADVYWPSGHCARCVWHTRFDDSVGVTDSHSPSTHSASVAHSSPLSAPDHVSDVHVAHVRSDDGVPALD